jgi:hypothetical protein
MAAFEAMSILNRTPLACFFYIHDQPLWGCFFVYFFGHKKTLVKKTVANGKIDDVGRRSFSTNRVRIHVKLFDVPRIRVAAGLYPGTN